MRETEPDVGTEDISAGNLQLIVPNLHRRYPASPRPTAWWRRNSLKLFRAAWLGPDAPGGIARMGLADLLRLWRRGTPLVWHARRNNEMIAVVCERSAGPEAGVHLGAPAPP